MPTDHHDLNYYRDLARTIAEKVESDIGIALLPLDIANIGDAIYRAVIIAKVNNA